MRNFIKNFAQDESGATAIEYGLIAALIAVVIIAGIGLLGKNLNTTFKNVGDTLGTESGKAPAAPAAGG